MNVTLSDVGTLAGALSFFLLLPEFLGEIRLRQIQEVLEQRLLKKRAFIPRALRFPIDLLLFYLDIENVSLRASLIFLAIGLFIISTIIAFICN